MQRVTQHTRTHTHTPPAPCAHTTQEVENGKDQVYQKDDFFDCLSCEALERSNMGGGGVCTRI